jgi:hypothetical protein
MSRPAAVVPNGTFALTIWQPWASLIMASAKPFEFRGHPAPFRFQHERIVIHAGKRAMREAELIDLINRAEDVDQRWTTGLNVTIALPILIEALSSPAMFPLGAGLGTAILGQPRRAAEVVPDVADSDRVDHSKWAWPLTAIEAFEAPIECSGAQGFWRWPDAADMARRAA